MSKALLLLLTPEGELEKQFDVNLPNIVLGRSPQANVVIASTEVSRTHAQISNTANGFFISDMGSTNGTFLNGEQIKPNQMFQLKSEDQVNLGEITLVFVLIPDAVSETGPAKNTEVPNNNFNTQQNYNYNTQVDDYKSVPLDYNEKIQQEIPQATPFNQPQAHPYVSTSLNQAQKITNVNGAPNMAQSFQYEPPTAQQQPLYIPPAAAPISSATSFSSYGSPAPSTSLSDEELSLASEIFGAESKQAKSKAGINFAGWEKMNLFRQKVGAVQQGGSQSSQPNMDINEEELFNQIMGGANNQTNIPSSVSVLENSANNFPTVTPKFASNELQVSKQIQAELPQAYVQKQLPPQDLRLDELVGNELATQKYAPDTESYYYPEASNQDPKHFLGKDYAFGDKQDASRDPFDDLKYKDEDSVFAKLKASPKELFGEKFKAVHHEEKTNVKTVLKNYALPIGLLIGAVVLAVFLFIRKSGVFG